MQHAIEARQMEVESGDAAKRAMMAAEVAVESGGEASVGGGDGE